MDQVVGATAVWLPKGAHLGWSVCVFVGHSPLGLLWVVCFMVVVCFCIVIFGLFHVLSELEGCLHVHFSAINHDVLERFRPAETTIALLARPRSICIRGSHPFEPRSLSALSTPVDAPSPAEWVNIQNPPKIIIQFCYYGFVIMDLSMNPPKLHIVNFRMQFCHVLSWNQLDEHLHKPKNYQQCDGTGMMVAVRNPLAKLRAPGNKPWQLCGRCHEVCHEGATVVLKIISYPEEARSNSGFANNLCIFSPYNLEKWLVIRTNSCSIQQILKHIYNKQTNQQSDQELTLDCKHLQQNQINNINLNNYVILCT